MRALWEQLKRRKVIRMAIAYCALSWLLVQVVALLIPVFDIPVWTLRLLILVVVLGFPFALMLSWSYAVTPAGLRREPTLPADPVETGIVASRPVAPTVAISTATPDAASIAVLPLVNMSSDKEQDYFSDGLSEELLNLLAQVPGLHVAGRTSSFSFKDKHATIAEVGKALNVATVLEGSVRKSGDRIRITAQLIKTRDGYHLWSQSYDRELTDIFAVQDEIAAAVVAALKLKLLPVGHPGVSRNYTPGPEAYDQFLLGRQFLNRATPEGFHRAVNAYRKAVALEPDYAAAHAGLALAEAYDSDYTDTDTALVEGRARAAAAAEQAVARDPNLGDAYAARAVLRFVFDLDWHGAADDFAQALAFNPGDVMTKWQYSRLLAALGRLPEAEATARQATRLDPLSAEAWEILGRYQIAQGDLDAATQSLERALDIAPEHGRAPVGLGMVAQLKGDPVAALRYYAHAEDVFQLVGQAIAEHDLGHTDASQQALAALVKDHAHAGAYQIAEVHAWRGEYDSAFEWLQRAVMQHDAGLQYLKYDPLLRGLREEARYALLLRQMRLPV